MTTPRIRHGCRRTAEKVGAGSQRDEADEDAFFGGTEIPEQASGIEGPPPLISPVSRETAEHRADDAQQPITSQRLDAVTSIRRSAMTGDALRTASTSALKWGSLRDPLSTKRCEHDESRASAHASDRHWGGPNRRRQN
jgi:hypothetical protein